MGARQEGALHIATHGDYYIYLRDIRQELAVLGGFHIDAVDRLHQPDGILVDLRLGFSTGGIANYCINFMENRRNSMDNNKQTMATPVWRGYTLTIEEGAGYYHIGEGKLRSLIDMHPHENFYVMNGKRVLIKRAKFEEYLDQATAV